MAETPPGKRWYYPRPADPIRPNPFSAWTSRAPMIGMTRAVDADGASLVSPDWNEHARNCTAESAFLNFAYRCRTSPEQAVYDPAMVVNGHSRPTRTPNLWVSAASSFSEPEWIELNWESPRTICEIQLLFDSALHFHFWQSWQGYPVRSVPSIIRDYRLIARRADGPRVTVAEVSRKLPSPPPPPRGARRRHPPAARDPRHQRPGPRASVPDPCVGRPLWRTSSPIALPCACATAFPLGFMPLPGASWWCWC